MRAPTSYISHFAAVSCCGEYALEKVRRSRNSTVVASRYSRV